MSIKSPQKSQPKSDNFSTESKAVGSFTLEEAEILFPVQAFVVQIERLPMKVLHYCEPKPFLY